MMKRWRLLAIAAVLNVIVGVGAAAAQTVIVRNVPAGSTIELVLNAATLGSATADPSGTATLPMDLSAAVNKTETDVFIFVDTCGERRRVLLVERGAPAPPDDAACERREISGVFLIRRVTSLVVNMAGANPTVLLIQGRFSLTPAGPGRFWPSPPTGLVLFGGTGLTRFRDAAALACGDTTPCTSDRSRLPYAVGVTFWMNDFLGAEASYVRPSVEEVNASGETFRFDSFLDAQVLTVVGKVGGPVGPVRIYGQAGGNYHRATSGTTQTFEDIIVSIDEVAQTIEGGTQAFELKTTGWGWTFGGGLEAWVTRHFGVYAEVGRTSLKGSAADEGDGSFDDGLTTVVVGARLRLGR